MDEIRNYIDGVWQSSSSSEYLDFANPATGESLGRVPLSTPEEVDQAAQAAAGAFADWRRTPAVDRVQYLFKLKYLLDENFENRWLCCEGAGIGGVLVTDLFTGLIDTRSSQVDKLVHDFLRRHAFVPTYEFNHTLLLPSKQMVPWPELFQWIPERVSYQVKGLQEMVRSHPDPIEPLKCEGVP